MSPLEAVLLVILGSLAAILLILSAILGIDELVERVKYRRSHR